VSAFVDRIKNEQESKELFKLYIQDELSSGKWLMYACEALNGPAKAPSAQMAGVSARRSTVTVERRAAGVHPARYLTLRARAS
jgi:hypothetical protein